MSASANETLVRFAIEAIWNRGDLDAADELFAAGFVNHDGVIADLVVGPEAIKTSAALHRLAFPDLHVTVDASSSDDDIVLLHWTARRGSADTDERGVLGTDRQLLKGITRIRLAAGRIAESWSEWDRTRVLQGLGLVPVE